VVGVGNWEMLLSVRDGGKGAGTGYLVMGTDARWEVLRAEGNLHWFFSWYRISSLDRERDHFSRFDLEIVSESAEIRYIYFFR
jgi:hypothetical protein